MADNTVIAAGQFTVTLTHPLWNSGIATTINGFRQDGQMAVAQQLMDNSKIVALANGNTITITNNNGAGTLTFSVTRTGSKGDMVKIANLLKKSNDSKGGTIKITQQMNGKDEHTTFYGCTVKSCPPIVIQGNDASDYQVVWNYGSVSYGDENMSDSE